MIRQADKKRFRTIAHKLGPVVTIAGKGLADGVMAELGRALADHELIKIRVNVGDRTERSDAIDAICANFGCELIQRIGNVAVIYKPADKPNPALSNLLRTDL